MEKLSNGSFELLSKTKSQMADELNMSLSTLQRKLKKAGLDIPRGYIPPAIQIQIYERLGWDPITKLKRDERK